MGSEQVADSTVKQGMDQGHKVADKASNTVKEGYKAAQQFAEGLDLGKFVRSEPWLAVAVAFAIGCAVTAIVRRAS
jgi:ElaB/YqjD/DUF883 family membrane-anchored ribosome-binding protein